MYFGFKGYLVRNVTFLCVCLTEFNAFYISFHNEISVEPILVPHIMKNNSRTCDINKISINVLVIREHIKVNLL
jgi:hypothetical protein